MATFAKTSFSASKYAKFRPSFPPSTFSTILKYHHGPKNLCIDLGAGHGYVARTLAPAFKDVVGIDPSQSMVTQATSTTSESNVTFRVGSAEDLGFVEDGSLDMAIATQAAHWFNYDIVWPQLTKKLRKGGTIAFCGYKDNVFVNHPAATKLLDHYSYGPGEELMGMYWEQPGRNILRDLLAAIVPPNTDFEDVTRIEYQPGTDGANSGVGERLMYKTVTLGAMEGYVRTFSAYNNWAEAHPDEKPKIEGGSGDVVDDMFEKMLEAEPEWKKEGQNWKDKEIETEWGSVILLARKK